MLAIIILQNIPYIVKSKNNIITLATERSEYCYMKNPYEVIKIDKYTGKIQSPTLLLMNRSFNIIGKISRYDNWNISLVANGMDEISFEVHKYADGKLCPVWDDLIDLKIVNVKNFGYFEISVDYTDNTETVKSVHGISLETELSQISLYEFHVNDEDAADMEVTDYSADYDEDGNFIPTVFCNPDDEKHSLLHRALAGKAPHWSIGKVPDYIIPDEESKPELSSAFQRTYTVDGDSIYDFLTGTVAEESNVVFTFDVEAKEDEYGNTIYQRVINCYNLCDYIDPETGIRLGSPIGEDTTVFVSKRKLANEITISSNNDNVKNCFRIVGGDDVITDMVRAVNMNGSNYIYQFADFQYNDMSEALRQKISNYQTMMSSQETQDMYYGENGIYTRICKAYDDLGYYESSMMPNTDKVTEVGTAKAQYDRVVAELGKFPVAVSSMNNYNNDLFVGVTNNIEAYAQIFLDSRFDLEIVSGTTSYAYVKGSETGTWKGKIRITQHTDEKNVYPVNLSNVAPIEVTVNANELEFAKQKIQKALSSGSMLDIDFNIEEMSDEDMRNYFNQYSLSRLTSFYDGYNSCISILTTLGQTTDSDVKNEIYDTYYKRMEIVEEIKNIRQAQVNSINLQIAEIKKEQTAFQNDHDFQKHLGNKLYEEFCAYRREDTYSNSNYVSDGLSTAECLEKAKELIEVATKEAKKACMLQRTVSTSLNNLFALHEFEPLYDKFALFNYIRIRTEDEILKFRLIGIEFSGDSTEEIQVTFSEQIESADGTMSDVQSIMKQASSIATSYPSTALQAKQGSEARNAVMEMYTYGLNAAKTMLANNDNNEVTITRSGIICKRMDDEGFYGDKQLRLTGNIMAFTMNNWKTVEMAIGETTFLNPFTGQYETKYGICAPVIVGKLSASEKMYIGNKDGTVEITGNGIKIDRGTITWGSDNVNAPEMSDISGLTEFKNKVNTALTGSATEIGSDYVISPKIGGGYLYIKNENKNDERSVIIDPQQSYFGNEYIFRVTDKNGNITMGIKSNGDANFSGNISSSKIYLNSNSMDNLGSILLGNLIENLTNTTYKEIRIVNENDSNDENLAISLAFKNPSDSDFYSTTGIATIKKSGSIYNKLYANTYLGNDNTSFIGLSSDTYKGLYASNAIHTPRVYAGNYVHGDYALDVNGTSYFSNNLYLSSGSFIGGLAGGGIYISDELYVNGIGYINGDLYCNSPIDGSMVHVIVKNGIHQGALAVNGNNFGLWDSSYNKWMIHVNANGNVTTATTLSDRRLKSGIRNTSVNDALRQILNIKHREFTIDFNDQHKDIGYIAQELEKINPKMVIPPSDDSDYYHVDSFYLESIITKAIQEFYKQYEMEINTLEQRNEDLTKYIENLEQENKGFKQQIKKLENLIINTLPIKLK